LARGLTSTATAIAVRTNDRNGSLGMAQCLTIARTIQYHHTVPHAARPIHLYEHRWYSTNDALN